MYERRKMIEKTFNFVLLRANPDLLRHESLNAGVVVFDAANTCVLIDSTKKRLSTLHPDFGRMDLSLWAEQIQSELRKLPAESQRVMLPMLCAPFKADRELGETIGIDASTQAQALFERLVGNQRASLPVVKRLPVRQTKLTRELRDWFKTSKVFSSKVEDLSKNRVVANYPVSPASDLYADFALMNSKLHVVETLDLRGVDHLTPTLRGGAAIKGITLDEVGDNDNAIAVIVASDYGIARPAISLLSRYADDLYDLSANGERQRLADFMATSLHCGTMALPLN
jgi:Protein of unknown function (DUF3037)